MLCAGWIEASWVGKGVYLKRILPMGRGRAGIVRPLSLSGSLESLRPRDPDGQRTDAPPLIPDLHPPRRRSHAHGEGPLSILSLSCLFALPP